MKVTIKIECDTIAEFYAHMGAIRMQIKKETRRLKLDIHEDEFPSDADLDDANCYGSHEVEIVPEMIEQQEKECTHCQEEDPVFGMKYPCHCKQILEQPKQQQQ